MTASKSRETRILSTTLGHNGLEAWNIWRCVMCKLADRGNDDRHLYQRNDKSLVCLGSRNQNRGSYLKKYSKTCLTRSFSSFGEVWGGFCRQTRYKPFQTVPQTVLIDDQKNVPSVCDGPYTVWTKV